MTESATGAHSSRLTFYIVAAIVAAIILALLFPKIAVGLDVGGEVFLRLLQMVVVPLVMASVMSGILGLGDVRKLGKPGGYAILYYLTTTVLAVGTGLVVVNLINPGQHVPKAFVKEAQKEGAAAVEEASNALSESSREVTWSRLFGRDSIVLTEKTSSDVSDVAIVPSGRQMVVAIRIETSGKADRPATVIIETRGDEGNFQPLTWTDANGIERQQVEAGLEPDTYVTNVPLPDSTKRIRLKYTAQEGGASSTIHARIIRGKPTLFDIFKNLILMLFTNNLLQSMVEMNLLPIIVFSIVFASMLTTMGERGESIATLLVAINDALMNFILLLMNVAPLGIFCLVASRFGKAQLEGQFVEMIKIQFYYMATVIAGLAIHALITLPLLLWIFTRRNPFRFMLQMSQAVLTAFSTASSTATLPVTMECVEANAGVSKRSAEFVLPLGATINMDGTALYEAAAAIFIAQAFALTGMGPALTFDQQITIAITATLAAIGAAGIPEAGLVTMLIVLNAVNLPLELIGLILPVDWLLDRFRTAVNSFGDSVGATIIDQTFDD